MLITLSPSKTLNFDVPLRQDHTDLMFREQTLELIGILKKKSSDDIAKLMKLSPKLAELNYERYQTFASKAADEQARCAIDVFKGNVYDGLDVEVLSDKDIAYAQDCLRILSGLYGILKPLDVMKPYRLEMGTSLPNAAGKDLYAFWQESITTEVLNHIHHHNSPAVINLASNEYAKAVNWKAVPIPVIVPEFRDLKNGAYKMIMPYVKKARGLMARFIIQERLTDVDAIKAFDWEGYRYDQERSDWNKGHVVFLRDEVV